MFPASSVAVSVIPFEYSAFVVPTSSVPEKALFAPG